jgi:hypothetical protein
MMLKYLCLAWFNKKILRNEIDEDFKDVFYQIKHTMKDLLYGVLEQENPSKNKNALNQMLEEKVQENISYSCCLKIVDMMYKESNPKRSEIIKAIQEKLEKKAEKR